VLSVFDFYFAVLLTLRAPPSAINLQTTNDSVGLMEATFVILMNANLREMRRPIAKTANPQKELENYHHRPRAGASSVLDEPAGQPGFHSRQPV
jgi:hypothetical protein